MGSRDQQRSAILDIRKLHLLHSHLLLSHRPLYPGSGTRRSESQQKSLHCYRLGWLHNRHNSASRSQPWKTSAPRRGLPSQVEKIHLTATKPQVHVKIWSPDSQGEDKRVNMYDSMSLSQRPLPYFSDGFCSEFWEFKRALQRRLRSAHVIDGTRLEALVDVYNGPIKRAFKGCLQLEDQTMGYKQAWDLPEKTAREQVSVHLSTNKEYFARLATIHERTEADQWRHVGSAENPADDASWSMWEKKMAMGAKWLQGPSFLKQDEDCWPKDSLSITNISCVVPLIAICAPLTVTYSIRRLPDVVIPHECPIKSGHLQLP
ncbi:hypothetical protein O3P69_004935 [Scylla paramamosain]|uniref:Uncharacterized protein n=1 Tax=Scylla paramamosain TaxID=85552 RepID=A0AAW0U980_SCYPA